MPLLRVRKASAVHDAAVIAKQFHSKVRPVVEEVVLWRDGEVRFLERLLDDGEIEPEHLSDDATTQERVSSQPMLVWKQKNIREHKGLDAQ